MSNLLIGLLSALVATNQPAAVSNLVQETTGIKVEIPDPNDPVEMAYKRLMEDDDAAMDEVDKWIQENRAFTAKGAAESKESLNARIKTRLATMRKEYDDFLKQHPNHARAHLAYGSFLADTGDEETAEKEWEKARELDPKNPAAWNNLANYYGHDGPIKKAFEYYEKAIELDPTESVYYHNMGTTVYLFRKDAMEYYHTNEQAIFTKALDLYSKAVKLDPTNFALLTDVAQTYYGIKPTRTDDALNAWSNALHIATTDVEREGIYIHLARFELNADRFAESHAHLNMVTNSTYDDLKARLTKNLAKREREKATGIKEPDPLADKFPKKTPPVDFANASDDQIKKETVGRNIDDAQKALGLENYDRHTMENGEAGFPVFRYKIGERFLFLKTDSSNKILEAFFSSPHAALENGTTQQGATNQAAKPR